MKILDRSQLYHWQMFAVKWKAGRNCSEEHTSIKINPNQALCLIPTSLKAPKLGKIIPKEKYK
jgi:hypothetical protein